MPVLVKSDTVWLTANQMAELFERENNKQKMRVVGVKQPLPFYTPDVIISVGYGVKSKRGVEFRHWLIPY